MPPRTELDKELCKIFKINVFEQYLINESDRIDDELEQRGLTDDQRSRLQAKKETLKDIREKYFENKLNNK